MEPDDLLCSRNARSRTLLVARAQWKINQAPSPPSCYGLLHSNFSAIACRGENSNEHIG